MRGRRHQHNDTTWPGTLEIVYLIFGCLDYSVLCAGHGFHRTARQGQEKPPAPKSTVRRVCSLAQQKYSCEPGQRRPHAYSLAPFRKGPPTCIATKRVTCQHAGKRGAQTLVMTPEYARYAIPATKHAPATRLTCCLPSLNAMACDSKCAWRPALMLHACLNLRARGKPVEL